MSEQSTESATPTEEQPPAETKQTKADLPEWAQRELENARREAATYRTKLREIEPLAAEAAALKEAQQTEAEKIAQRLADAEKNAETAQAALRSSRIENALLAAAGGVLADPNDAVLYLASKVEPDETGQVDPAQVKQHIDELLASKPYLAAQGDGRPKGDVDQGVRVAPDAKPQLTDADVERLYAEKKYDEIEQARRDGRLNKILGVT